MSEHLSGPKGPLELDSEQDFVAFDHVAAGQYVNENSLGVQPLQRPNLELPKVANFAPSEGIQSDASSGSLIIKPCEAAEIAFYESAAFHPDFQSHMPTYVGKLTQNNDQSLDHPTAAEIANWHAGSDQLTPSLPSAPSSKRMSWKPSGGKKLNTGLAVVLENVAAGFTKPNILDVKLGARLWADDAPPAKRQKLDDASRQTTSGSLGFRIAGMKVWKGKDAAVPTPVVGLDIKDGYRKYGREYGRILTKDNVKEGFVEYLGGTDSQGKLQAPRSRTMVDRLISELLSIEHVLEHEESRMYSASILMVYEGDQQALEIALREEEIRETAEAENRARGTAEKVDGDPANEAEEDEEEDDDDDEDADETPDPKVHDVRLIDFAHATWTPGGGPDENVLQGVRGVLKILREIADHGGNRGGGT